VYLEYRPIRKSGWQTTHLHVPTVLEPPVPVQACTVIPLLFVTHLFNYKTYKWIYSYSGHDVIWRSGGTVPVILKIDRNTSNQRHAKTNVPPNHLTRRRSSGYPWVGGPQSSSESFTVTACLQDVEPLLLGSQYIHIEIFLHNDVVGCLVTVVFAALFFLVCIYRYVRWTAHISVLNWRDVNSTADRHSLEVAPRYQPTRRLSDRVTAAKFGKLMRVYIYEIVNDVSRR
jgi:hypothetical protein